MGIVKVLTPALGEPDKREILRYMGAVESSSELDLLIESCISEVMPRLSPRICFGTFDVSLGAGEVDMGFTRVFSRDLSVALEGCDRAIVMGATIGIELDRLIALYGRTHPARALCIQSIGACQVEALCDGFENTLRKEGLSLRPRFSAGYGDLPLELQQELFRVLDCSRRIGLSLNDSLLMSPTKSVTAIIGIESV